MMLARLHANTMSSESGSAFVVEEWEGSAKRLKRLREIDLPCTTLAPSSPVNHFERVLSAELNGRRAEDEREWRSILSFMGTLSCAVERGTQARREEERQREDERRARLTNETLARMTEERMNNPLGALPAMREEWNQRTGSPWMPSQQGLEE